MKNIERFVKEIAGSLMKYSQLKYEGKIDNDHSFIYFEPSIYNVNDVEKWLLAERKEPIKITKAEKVILENLPQEYEWIARDKDDDAIKIFENEPTKYVSCWVANCIHGYRLSVFNHLFQFIKWDDEEPVHIPTLLKECEVVD